MSAPIEDPAVDDDWSGEGWSDDDMADQLSAGMRLGRCTCHEDHHRDCGSHVGRPGLLRGRFAWAIRSLAGGRK